MKHSRLSALAIAFLMAAGAMVVTVNVTAWGEIDEEGIFETVEDYDGDGKINYLVINVPIQNISWFGSSYLRDYIAIDWELWNETGTQNIGWGTAEQDITPYSEENITVEVRILGRMINASGIDGPYLVKMCVNHFVVIPVFPGPYPIVSEGLGCFEYITDEYAHDDFETPDPYTMSIDWEVVDDDDDGLHDWLRVNLTVNATDGDIVEISLELSEEVGPDLITYGDQRTLAAGYNQTVAVDIDGRLMNGLAREDTRYWIHISVATLDGFKEWGWVKTDPLNASDFEDYVVSVADGPVLTLIDFNDDGLYDFLRVTFNTTVQETLKYSLGVRLDDEDGLWGSTEYFNGYLIAGYEETVAVYFDAADMFEEGVVGPFEIEIVETPTTYRKWPDYAYISPIFMANMSVEELDIDELNHPEYVSLSGYVADEGGDPVSGSQVLVSFLCDRLPWSGSDIDVTDEDGFYSVTSIVSGSAFVEVNVESTGFFNKTRAIADLDTNTSDFNFTLESDTPADSEVWGTVFDSEGIPAPGAMIGVVKDGAMVTYTYTDGAGEYQFDLKAGDYSMIAQAANIDIWNETLIMEFSAAWISLEPGESVNTDVTLNVTLDFFEASGMKLSADLRFDSWDDLALTTTLTLELAGMEDVFAISADILYGDADGYVDEDESALPAWILSQTYLALMGFYDHAPLLCELYSLDDFSVDGTGYLGQPDGVALTLPDLTGPIWDETEETFIQLDHANFRPFWPIPEDASHELYLEVGYALEEDSYLIDEDYEITAPEGFVLTSTNGPENVSIDGLNHVTVVPGVSPDPYNGSSVLVILEFSSTTSDELGSVFGTAVLQGQEDSSGTTVELLNSTLEALASATTAANGEFVFSDLNPGEYWIRANHSGYLDAFEQAAVVTGATTEVSIVLLPSGSTVAPGNISGAVVTEAGLPIGGALVEAYTPSGGATLTESIETDDQGAFEITGLPPGDYRIEISAEGFDTKTIYDILEEGEEKDLGTIELTSDSPVGYIIGSLEDTEGNPVVGAVVEVRADGSSVVLGENITGSDGGFLTTDLEDGLYNLTFVLDGSIIGYGAVTVDDFIGDAGVIVVDLSDADVLGDDDPIWSLILLLAAVAAVAAVALVLKLRKPKSPQPTTVEGGEEAPVGPE